MVAARNEFAGMKEWVEVAIGDLIDIDHGYAFKGQSIHDDPQDQSDILLTPGNFAIGGGFKGDKFKYYDGDAPEGFVLHSNDLLVTMTDLSKESDTLGYPALVPSRTDNRRYLHNQRLGKIKLKETNDVDFRYLYYVMCSRDYRNEILASCTGTTVKHTSPERIKQYRFLLPPKEEQEAIAHVLGTLDDKIELNRRMNRTLEEMARAIFQDWFVDFGPTRAKIEGQEPYLPPELWDLFPDQLVDSEKGEIPEGWQVKPLGKVVELFGGTTPSTKRPEYWNEGTHCWVTPKDLSQLTSPILLDTERKITDAGVNKISSGLHPQGTLLLSSRAPIGYLAISEVPVATNQGFIAMPPRSSPSNWYMLHWCRASHEEIISHANGSTFLEISKANFRNITMALPATEILPEFDKLVGRLYKRVSVNQRESQTLATKRDEFLPRLLSGEIKPKEREY